HTGWWKYAWCGPEADEERYIHRHPGAHPDMVEWLKKKKIHIWGVDCVSTDHPLCLPIGRWLGKGGLEIHQRVKDLFEKKYGKEMLEMMLSPEYYQLTHNKLFPHDCVHLENLGGEIGAPELQNKRVTIFCLPILIEGAESAWTRVVALLE
ncbi:MAG: cyclase family protein, partial [Thaumarchaeota archaeon]|nr:cyclase family protein [Nitrososphaerota archaeon]